MALRLKRKAKKAPDGVSTYKLSAEERENLLADLRANPRTELLAKVLDPHQAKAVAEGLGGETVEPQGTVAWDDYGRALPERRPHFMSVRHDAFLRRADTRITRTQFALTRRKTRVLTLTLFVLSIPCSRLSIFCVQSQVISHIS